MDGFADGIGCARNRIGFIFRRDWRVGMNRAGTLRVHHGRRDARMPCEWDAFVFLRCVASRRRIAVCVACLAADRTRARVCFGAIVRDIGRDRDRRVGWVDGMDGGFGISLRVEWWRDAIEGRGTRPAAF